MRRSIAWWSPWAPNRKPPGPARMEPSRSIRFRPGRPACSLMARARASASPRSRSRTTPMEPSMPANDATRALHALMGRVEALRKRHPEQAWQLLERGFGACARASDDAGRGELWRLRGHVLRGLQRARPAALAYRRAAAWDRRAGDPREQGRCAIGPTDSPLYLGRFREAQRAAAAGRRLLERAGDRVSLARLLNNEGNLFHRLDLPDRALLRYREARRALARAGGARGAAVGAGNVANCLSLLGRLDQARKLYRDARRVHDAAGYELDALIADYKLGYLDI